MSLPRPPHAAPGAADEAPPVPGLAALPRERAPERDLWPGIAARLSPVAAPAPAQTPARRRAEPSLWPYALAASIVVTLTAGLLLRLPSSPVPVADTTVALASPVPEATPAAAGERPVTAPRGVRHLRSESLDDAPALVAERAASPEGGLMKATYSSRSGGAEAHQAILRAHLKLATQAEREVRRALKADPESQSLQRLLTSAQQQRERLTSLLIHEPG